MKQTHAVIPQLFESSGYRAIDPTQFKPGKVWVGKISEAEKQYVGFDFKGPGWYQLAGCTLLAVPMVWPSPSGYVPTIEGHEQLWAFYAYPACAQWWQFSPVDAIRYLATLDWRQVTEKRMPEARGVPRIVSATQAKAEMEADGGPTKDAHGYSPYDSKEEEMEARAQPMEIVLPPGAALRVSFKDSDGTFDITFDKNGDQRVVVSADMPGNVMGGEGPIYVEDFGQDNTGTQMDKTEMPVSTAMPVEPYTPFAPGKTTLASTKPNPIATVQKKSPKANRPIPTVATKPARKSRKA